MQGLSLPENTLVIWAHPAFTRDAVRFMGRHQLVKELQCPCSEAGERAVGLVLDAVAGRRSWESLFLGVEAPQKLAGVPVNETGDLQCPACQGTSSARQCGNRLSSSPACWRLPDERGQYKWLSITALDQLKATKKWLDPVTRQQCMRELLMRAYHNTMFSGAMQLSEVSTSFDESEQEMSCMAGAVLCLGPGMQELLNRLKLTFEMQWYTDIMVVQASNAANMCCGERQARIQAAKLAQYELHVLVAQPHAQEEFPKSPVQQPRMVLDGAELETAMVNSLLDMASSKADQPANLRSANLCTVNAPARSPPGRTEPKARAAVCTTAERAAADAEPVCGASEAGFRRLLGAMAQKRTAPQASSAPKHPQSLAPPTQAQIALTKGALQNLLQPLRRTKPSMGPISSILSGGKEAPFADASEAAARSQLSVEIASLAQAVFSQQRQRSGASPGPGHTPGEAKSGAKQATRQTNGSACSGQCASAAESGDQSQKQPRPSLEDMRMSLLQKISGVPRGLSGGLGAHVGAAQKPAASETAATQLLGNTQPAISCSAASRPLGHFEPASVSQSAAVEVRSHEEPALPQCSGQVCRNQSSDGNGIGTASGGRDQAMRLPPGIHRHAPRITHLEHLASMSRAHASESAVADVQASPGGGGSSRDSASRQDVPSNSIPADSRLPQPHRKPAYSPAVSAAAPAEVQLLRKPNGGSAAPVVHVAQRGSGRQPAATAIAPAKTVTLSEPALVPNAEGMEQEPSSLPTASSDAHQAPEQPRRHAGPVEVEAPARSSTTGMAIESVDVLNASEGAAVVNAALQQHSSGRPCHSTSTAPPRRISHLEMESSVVGDSCRQEPQTPAAKPRNRGGRPRGQGHGRGRGRGRSRQRNRPQPVDPPAPRAVPVRRERTPAEGDPIPYSFTVRRPRSMRTAGRDQGLQTGESPPQGLPPAMAAGHVQLPQPQAPNTMPDPTALETLPSRTSSRDVPGNAAPLNAQVVPKAAEAPSPVEEVRGSPTAAADAAADVDSGAVEATATGNDPSGDGTAAGELEAAADAGCALELSVSRQERSAGCTAAPNGIAPEGSGVTVPVEDAEAAEEVLLKKRRKKASQETISASLSPPGAFGRAVFGRKKRGSDDVATYNEKKLRQQRWKAEQKELQERRERRRANKAERMAQADDTAYACGDRTQLLMRLLPNNGINNGHAGFRMSVLCSTVLADADAFMSLNLDSCEKRLIAGLEQSCGRTLSKSDEAALRVHKEELDCLAAYLKSPSDRPLQKQGARRGRKPGRPRKTLRLGSTPEAADASEADASSAPEPSAAQIPGTQPAALPPPDAAARRRGRKPGRPPKKPAAKFADPTALSAQSGEDAASAGVSVGLGAPSATAAASSPAASASAGGLQADGRAASGCVTSALDAVTELCRDVNPPGYASSDGATPAQPIFAGRSRLHVSSGVPPSPAALQQADAPAAEQGGREDPINAKTADVGTSSELPTNKVSPTALSAAPDIAVESVPTEAADEAAGQQEVTPTGPHKPANQKCDERTAGNKPDATQAEAVVPGTPGELGVQQGAPVAAGAGPPAAEGQPAKRKRGRPPGSKNKRPRTAEQPKTEGTNPSTAGPESAAAATALLPAAGKDGTEAQPAEPAVAPGSATGALAAAVKRKPGRPPGRKNKGGAAAPIPAAQKQQGKGTDAQAAKLAVAPSWAIGTLAAAPPAIAQSAAAEHAKAPDQPKAVGQVKPATPKKAASAADAEQPSSALKAQKTGKGKRSASALAHEVSPGKTRSSAQQQSRSGAARGKTPIAQQKTGSRVAVSQAKAPAAASQHTPTSAQTAEERSAPARTAANDWRLMKVRRMATWKDIYSRVP